jgi:hypothetical protein
MYVEEIKTILQLLLILESSCAQQTPAIPPPITIINYLKRVVLKLKNEFTS